MKPRFLHDPFATHQPVLYEAVLCTTGPVIEFGCGHGSTPMLHHLCTRQNRKLLTLDTDKEWLDKFTGYATPQHAFIHVDNWDAALIGDDRVVEPCDVAFVDQAPFEARYYTILAIRNTAKFIVLHDCDYFPDREMLGTTQVAICHAEQKGSRTYHFKHYKEFFPLEPWPHPYTGPPTLLASNFESCDWDIDFEKYREEELML